MVESFVERNKQFWQMQQEHVGKYFKHARGIRRKCRRVNLVMSLVEPLVEIFGVQHTMHEIETSIIEYYQCNGGIDHPRQRKVMCLEIFRVRGIMQNQCINDQSRYDGDQQTGNRLDKVDLQHVSSVLVLFFSIVPF